MVDLFRDQVVTASASGDSTTGDATLLGDFTANTVTAFDSLYVENVVAKTAGNPVAIAAPVQITTATNPIVATFNYGASGGRTRYTNGTVAWDIGMNNSTDQDFVMQFGNDIHLTLRANGQLIVDTFKVNDSMEMVGDMSITGDLTATGNITANTATFVTATSNDFRGQFTGDIYHPDGSKVFENGGPASNIPATFTGNVNGTVSSLTNHTTDSLKEGNTNLYYTNARVRGALTAGTGVGIIADPNDSNKTLIAIGQAVNTNSNVAFKTITLNDGATTNRNESIYLNGSNGTIVAEGNITAYGSVSDITMKENISPISDALEKVSKLGGYIFNYKGDETPMTGVMAQELMEVLPEVVYEIENPKTGKTTYAVRHGNIVGLLIEAIKELSAKIDKK